MARRFSYRFRRNVNIPRVVAKIVGTVLALYVGGTIMTELGSIMINTSSVFHRGFTLIGWTVGSTPTNGSNYPPSCGAVANASITSAPTSVSNCITATSGAGLLSVIGIIGIASIVMEFVEFRLN